MADQARLIKTGGGRLHHAPSLDGFRGAGVLIVVFYHAEVLSWMAGSPILIDWFFVASGFLITMIVLDERESTGTNSLRRFYERRILRLFPAMYAMIAAFVVAMLIATLAVPSVREEAGGWWIDALGAATYSYYLLAAIIPDKVTGLIGHTWSLSLEEQFYFIWPLILFFVLNRARRKTDRGLLIAIVAFMATMIALRMGLHNHIARIGQPDQTVAEIGYTDDGDPTFAGIVYRIAGVRPDMIAYGCLLAIIHKRLPDPLPDRLRRLLTTLSNIGVVVIFGYILAGNRFRGLQIAGRGFFDLIGGPAYNIALLFLGPFVLDLYRRSDGLFARTISWKPFRYLGVRTYGIYLWHVIALLPFLAMITDLWGVRRLAVGVVAGTVAVIPGILSFRYIERPFLHLKDTKFRRPQDELRSSRAAGSGDRPGSVTTGTDQESGGN